MLVRRLPVRSGLAVLRWLTLWYPTFAMCAGLWLGYRAVLVDLPGGCQRLVVALLFLFMPLAGSVQAAWFRDAWETWRRTVNGSHRMFAAYVVTAVAPAVLAGWWLWACTAAA